MPVQTINIDRVESQLAELLAIVEHDGEILIAQNGTLLARLEPVMRLNKKKRIAGLNRGMISTTADFDEPLSDEFWLGKE